MGRTSSGVGDSLITLVVSESQLRGDEVVFDGHVYRHLFRARRLAPDAVVRLVDGQGRARLGRPLKIDASTARFALGAEVPSNEPTRYVELMAPVPKSSRLSWMVEKATEIGVSAIRLIHTERAPREVGVGTLERLGRVAVAAVEQSNRSVVPVISGVHAFAELPELMNSISERWYLQPGSALRRARSSEEKALLLVGPEGGWTHGETQQMTDWGCSPLGLGPTVLRIETAATVGCAGLLVPGLLQ